MCFVLWLIFRCSSAICLALNWKKKKSSIPSASAWNKHSGWVCILLVRQNLSEFLSWWEQEVMIELRKLVPPDSKECTLCYAKYTGNEVFNNHALIKYVGTFIWSIFRFHRHLEAYKYGYSHRTYILPPCTLTLLSREAKYSKLTSNREWTCRLRSTFVT